jgi:sigma-B regulation protein RsbU (phosphoserine phosphatase)
MMTVVQRYARRKLSAWGWLPLSRLARLTLYFAGLDLLLAVLWQLSRLVHLSAGRDLGGWVIFLTYVSAGLALLLAARWVRRRLMWRLRNRLIVTYTFIGVIPVLLLLAIGVIGAYLLAWQFATFVAATDLQTELRKLGALNARAGSDLAEQMRRGATPSRELLQAIVGREVSHEHREVTAWFRGAAVSLEGAPATPPPEATPEVEAFSFDGKRILLRAAATLAVGKDKLVVISSIPLNRQMLERIAPGLGELTFSPFEPAPQAPPSGTSAGPTEPQQGGVQLRIGSESVRLDSSRPRAPDTPASVQGGTLPPPAGRFDREITAYSTLPALDWRTGKPRLGLLLVRTRPSLLYARLFRTVGDFARYIVTVLAVIAVFFAVIELLALFIGVRLTRTMTRSVAELYGATQRVNQGDLSHRIQVTRQDQMAALEESFNSMTESLQRLLAEQKEKQRLENELAIAQEVQEQLFPRQAMELESLELHGICRPARTVSGDYYDFLTLDNDKLAIAVGDVSGKGISAALLMATIHSAVRAYSLEVEEAPMLAAAMSSAGHSGPIYAAPSLAYANGDLSPALLISLLNRQLVHTTPEEKYATLFFGIYDGRTRRLSYTNAGHLPPLILGPDGSVRRLDIGGTVVGLFDGFTWEEAGVELAPGDIFLAYSDGITEPENDFGEFGEQRLVELVQENAHLPLARISEQVTAAVLDWIGEAEQPDDITLVLARPR